MRGIPKLIRSFLICYFNSKNREDIFFHKYDKPFKEHDREQFLIDICKEKRVLHIGFLDSPFYEQKVKDGSLLHSRIKDISDYCFGIDIDFETLEKYREVSLDYDNDIFDICKNISEEEYKTFDQHFDLILLPEVLEHLKNPGIALSNLKNICARNNAKLCITVPNSYYLLNFCAALNGNEIVHPGHYYFFSPYTLKKLLEDSDFKDIDIKIYISNEVKNISGLIKNGIIAICKPPNFMEI